MEHKWCEGTVEKDWQDWCSALKEGSGQSKSVCTDKTIKLVEEMILS